MMDQCRKEHQGYFEKLKTRLNKLKRDKMFMFDIENPVIGKEESEPILTEPEHVYKRGGNGRAKVSTLANVVDLIK